MCKFLSLVMSTTLQHTGSHVSEAGFQWITC